MKNINSAKRTITQCMLLGMLLIGPGQYLYAGLAISKQLIEGDFFCEERSQEELTEQLIDACKDGSVEEVKMLLAMPGIDINKADNDCCTPLYRASYMGHADIVKMFLKKPGIDFNKTNYSGKTPLYSASRYGHTEIVRMLLAMPGIDINKANRYDWTPISSASSQGHTEIVKMLLAMPGIDINKADHFGKAPLDASYMGHTEIVRMLLAMPGIDINQANNDNMTPLCMASYRGHIEIVKMLLAYGADDSSLDITKITHAGCLNALAEARAVWKHRNKFCCIDEEQNIQLLDDETLTSAVSKLSQEDQQAIIAFSSNANIPGNIDIVQTIKSVATKYLDILNNPESKANLENWYQRKLSNHHYIKTIKALLARRSYGLQSGALDRLPIELIAYDIGSFLDLDNSKPQTTNSLLQKRSDAIRTKTYHELIADDSQDASLIEADWNDAQNRLGDRYHNKQAYKTLVTSSRMISWLENHKSLDAQTGALILHPTKAHVTQ